VQIPSYSGQPDIKSKLKELFPEIVIAIDDKILRRSHQKNNGLKRYHSKTAGKNKF